MASISVITVFHNGRDLVQGYLEQWRKAPSVPNPPDLVFGDAGSTDGTAELVSGADDLADARLFPENVGFARGNNELARRAHGDVLLFLNPDVQLIPGWLDPIVSALDSWPELGVVGNVQLSVRRRETDHAGMFFDETGQPFHFRPPLVALEGFAVLPVPAATGACLAIRRNLFEQLGGFDPGYQNGYEDVDFCLRARAAGVEIAVATQSVIWHFGCASPGRHDWEERNAERFKSRWLDDACAMSRFRPPQLAIPPSRAKEHPAFSGHQTLQVFYPIAGGFREEASSVHLYPMGRWGRVAIALPRSFGVAGTVLRLDPGWERGSVVLGGLSFRSGPKRQLVWQAAGKRLAGICSAAGTSREISGSRGFAVESTGEDPQLLVHLPQNLAESDSPRSLEVFLRGERPAPRPNPITAHANPSARPHPAGGEMSGSMGPEGKSCRSLRAAGGSPSPVRVLVDLTRLLPGGEGGGIKPTLLAFLHRLAARDNPPLHFVYVTGADTRPEVLALQRPCDKILSAAEAPVDLAARELCDVVYCPFGIVDFACPGIPTVTLIVDLLHRDFPDTLSSADRLFRERCFVEAVTLTDRFQVISNFTAERLEHHFQVPAVQMVRTYPAVHERFQPCADNRHPGADRRPFFLYPANAWVHKNHAAMLTAFLAYRQMAGQNAWKLVLTGHDGDEMRRVRQLADKLRLAQDVDFAGYVSDRRLAELLQTAGGLVFPSLHEGFGIPLLEAMALGTPIVAHNGTAIPEVVGQAALLVDARDPVQLADAMLQLTCDQSLRAQLTARGRRRAAEFSMDRETDRLHLLFHEARQRVPRQACRGYHRVDGLTDPTAVFALPWTSGSITVDIRLRPLPADRTLQVWCGPEMAGEMRSKASAPAAARFTFTPKVPSLTLRAVNATRLCETDPRTHGVLLERLAAETAEGASFDLLALDA